MTSAMMDGISKEPFFLWVHQPIKMEIMIWKLMGITEPGYSTNKWAIIKANTAITIKTRRKIMIRKSNLDRGLITDFATLPIDSALCLAEITRAPKSCTAPMKIVPRTIHNNAGNHPQITAIAGPKMGAAPAMEEK